MKKIIFIHLLNDYSGSPKVLSQVIETVQKEGYDTALYTGAGSDGFLTNVTKNHHYYLYKRSENKLFTLASYLLSQMHLFLKLLKYRKSDVVIYINTMLPFGAAVAGRIMGKPVYYHIHETSIRPKILKNFLRSIIQRTASKIIFVSSALRESESFKGITQSVVYNVLPQDFMKTASKTQYHWKNDEDKFNVLMICSLKAYKGIDEFMQIAKLCKNNKTIDFTLILNSEKKEIDAYFSSSEIPSNVTILTKQRNLHPFYQNASLLLNLSHIDQCVETFGLTILEAMSYGVPCIVPPVGGPVELIEEDKEGYLIASCEAEKIALMIESLSGNEQECMRLSHNAKIKSGKFDAANFKKEILSVLDA